MATMLAIGWLAGNGVSRPNGVLVACVWLISNAEPVDNSKLGAINSGRGTVIVTESCPNFDLTLHRCKVYHARYPLKTQ